MTLLEVEHPEGRGVGVKILSGERNCFQYGLDQKMYFQVYKNQHI